MKRITVALSLVAPLLFAPVASADSLTIEEVNAVVDRADPAIQSCRRALDHKTGDEVAVVVKMTIDGSGHVTAAEAPGRVGACLEKVARRLQFPASGQSANFAFPFVIVPRR